MAGVALSPTPVSSSTWGGCHVLPPGQARSRCSQHLRGCLSGGDVIPSCREEPLLVTKGRGHAVSPRVKAGGYHTCVASRHAPPGLKKGLGGGVRGLRVFLAHPEARQHRRQFQGGHRRRPRPPSHWLASSACPLVTLRTATGTGMWLALGVSVTSSIMTLEDEKRGKPTMETPRRRPGAIPRLTRQTPLRSACAHRRA